MAVEAVNSTTPTSTTVTDSGDGRVNISETTLKKMTAQEIVDGYNTQNWNVPQEILDWANNEIQTNPNSTTTYGESGAGGVGGEGEDVVSYSAMLDELGVGKKTKCKILTKISRDMEFEDMVNIAMIAPFAQEQPEDEADGNGEESAVSQVLNEIMGDMKDGYKGSFLGMRFGSNKFQEGQKFFSAFNAGITAANDENAKFKGRTKVLIMAANAKEELYEIDDSLDSMLNVLNDTSQHAKQSIVTGTETLEAGKELKSSAKWYHFGRKHVARKAIDQGEETKIMGENTKKLSDAIMKDNGLVKESVEGNIDAIEGAESAAGGGEGGSSTPTGGSSTGSSGASTGGATA
ncbi:MAG: hypothetical protein NC200_03325 [Candidatus Gastranaerophilales bacterium]|nr:hypothetical protein [Candidatus Gastranaerophilales bacterium]